MKIRSYTASSMILPSNFIMTKIGVGLSDSYSAAKKWCFRVDWVPFSMEHIPFCVTCKTENVFSLSFFFKDTRRNRTGYLLRNMFHNRPLFFENFPFKFPRVCGDFLITLPPITGHAGFASHFPSSDILLQMVTTTSRARNAPIYG